MEYLMKTSNLGLLFLAGWLSLTSPTSAQKQMDRANPETVGLEPAIIAQITPLLEDMVASQRLSGAVVGVVKHGQIAYLEAVGLQDVQSLAPMTESTLFRIYSMTKAVSAVATMILHEEGHFELSDPVSRYLPEFGQVEVLQADGSTRPPNQAATIEHLLLHTAGLSHRRSAEYREAKVRSRSITLSQLVDNVVSVPLRSDPGSEYLYSISPTILGRLVEVWSGQSFDEFVEERILRPLGMSDTSFWVEPGDQDRLASVYSLSDGGGLNPYAIEEVPFTERPALLEGAVGLVSTVPDFLRFSQMLLNYGEFDGARILSRNTVEMITQNGLPHEILQTRAGGEGWALGNVSVVVDETAAEQGARAGEYRWNGSAGTGFWVDPTTETVIVTMWQSSPSNPNRLRERIRTLVRQAIQD
mgnify:CR=1 FL=1